MAIKNRLVAGALLAMCVSTASAQTVDGRNYDGLLDCKNGSRLPLQRVGHLHYYNNYQLGCADGWDTHPDRLFLHGEPSRQNR